jgi:hypothetical protein
VFFNEAETKTKFLTQWRRDAEKAKEEILLFKFFLCVIASLRYYYVLIFRVFHFFVLSRNTLCLGDV